MSHAVIKVDDLTKCFGELVAVDHVDFAVPAGSVTGLLGGNGAGKTTTLSMLLGLSLPSSGSIEILGHQMPRDRRAILPRLNFSSPYVDLPHRLTVEENLTVYGHLYGLPQVAKRIRRVAAELDIDRFLKRPTGSLSAGQKTRVALAKALLNRPQVLMLDEPTASLDPDTADWIRTYLERYRDDAGATILLASHNMDEVQRLCAQVLVMRRGRIVARGTPADLLDRFGRERLEDVFIDIARDRRADNQADAA